MTSVFCARNGSRNDHSVQDIQWHDERDVDFRKTKLEKCWGLIVNCKGHGQWVSMVANSRHWYGIRKFKDCWYFPLAPLNLQGTTPQIPLIPLRDADIAAGVARFLEFWGVLCVGLCLVIRS